MGRLEMTCSYLLREDVLVGRRVHEVLDDGPEEHLIRELLPLGDGDVDHDGLLVGDI